MHPFAVEILAEIMESASGRMQIVVSTQSLALVDCFDPGDIVVACREEGASAFRRLNKDDPDVWLEEYSLGELRRKNVIAGGPVHEGR